ncbi:MAG TPA: IS4 family transposase [Candidatus Brocadiales bacterium]|nr:IS4 family transposase [Candidatus Brocadiales bacterium]
MDYKGKFGDKRLDKRAVIISNSLMQSKVSSIRRSTGDEASQKAAYRFLNNDKVEEKILIDALRQKAGHLSADRHVLVIQDTTCIDLSSHKGRLQEETGFGPIGNHQGNAWGFNLHGALVVDAFRQTLLGFSSYHQWGRAINQGNRYNREYKKKPIEQKEAFKWLRGCTESKETLSSARSITFIEDREGDIYDQFALIPDERTHLIIRSRDNRTIEDGNKLYDVLEVAPLAGCFELVIDGDSRKQVKKRTATIEVRYTTVEIRRPQWGKNHLPEKVKLCAVEAKEIGSQVDKPIIWRLLTTHAVEDITTAMWIIQCYKCRWYIEQFFRLMKKKGFRIEDSELERGWAIRKLSVLLAGVVLKIMQMLLSYGAEESQPIEEIYDEKERQCMEMLQQKLQTEKVKNPYSKNSLNWGTWIIARLGGWKGTAKERPPGPICLKNGLDKFNLIFQGWILAKNMS